MRGRHTEARLLLARLAGTSADSEEVDTELTNIKDALEAQSRDGPFKMKELLHNGPSQNLRRTLLGVASQFFQQISGINLIVRTPSDIAVVNHKLTLLSLDLLRNLRLRELTRFWPRHVPSPVRLQRYRILPRRTSRNSIDRTSWSSQTHALWCVRHDG